MLLGVPCVAVIAGLLEDWVNERLEAKNIDMPIVKNEKEMCIRDRVLISF